MADLVTRTMELLHGSQAASEQWTREAMEAHPYFVAPLVLYARSGGNNAELLQRLALAAPDRTAAAVATGRLPAHFGNFYPDDKGKSNTPSTNEAIDTFLQNYGHTSQREVEAISEAIFNPTPDYADVLAAQDSEQQNGPDEQQNKSRQEQLIDSFLQLSREQDRQAAEQRRKQQLEQQEQRRQEARQQQEQNVKKTTADDNSMLSESLAKMYIARRKYRKALEIIQNINLNFPEKSVYFAHQIRFLTKLVMNEEAMQQQQKQ